LCALVLACEAPRLVVPPLAPDAIRAACALTQRKCTGCHDIDKVTAAHHTRDDWPPIVRRMREIPGSAISEHDAEIVLTCLDYLETSRANAM
jgi:hypothetical protein